MKSLIAFLPFALYCASIARAQTLEWTRQFGTSSSDIGSGVSADGLGNVYISGQTEGDLAGTNAGGVDAFVTKYDATGALQWIRQLGTSNVDWSRDVSADGLGYVYVSGGTYGSLGRTNAGRSDAFLSKYDATGTLIWTRQLGASSFDGSEGVSADGLGNVYISGSTSGDLGGTNAGASDAFVGKFDANGTLRWTRQLGTSDRDWSYGVSADGLGSVYISGYTQGSLAGTNAGKDDVFLAKYDATGTLIWTRQLGTSSSDRSYGVSADGRGNVYISGYTEGSLGETNAGDLDAFVSKYDASGTLQWIRQFGTSSLDWSAGVSTDGLGNVYTSGSANGSLGGTHAGSKDAFVSKYDDSGALVWTRQLGTSRWEYGRGVSADGFGNVYISVDSNGSLGGTNAGSYDVFFARFWADAPDLNADFDFDGDVDRDDFSLWQNGFATICCTATKGDGDYDNDGDVDGDDFLGWQIEFGSGSGAASAAVPEPASVVLLLVLVTGGMLSRRGGISRPSR